MSSASLDLVRSIYAAWENGDYGSAEWADPEIEFVMVDGPAPGHWTGVAAMAEVWRDVMSPFEGLQAEAKQYRALDNDRILVLTRNTGRGKLSGLELDEMRTQGANVFHVHGGRVTKLILYWRREQALADLGLTPDTGT